MPKFEQTTFLTLLQNHDTNTCNSAKCFWYATTYFKVPCSSSVHSKKKQLMSFTGYMLTLSWAPQWSLGVLTDVCFLRDKVAVLSAAITSRACRACRTVCDDTAPQWSLGVLTDVCFLRDKAAVLSTAITRRACRTVCDDTAPHMFRKFNGLLLILRKHLPWLRRVK